MTDVSRFTDADWARLAALVVERRVELEMRQEDVARAAGVSLGTVGNLESGKRVQLINLSKIARAIRWTPGSCMAILRDETPTLTDEPVTQSDALRFQRPDKISDAAWEEIREQMAADFERYLRWRGR